MTELTYTIKDKMGLHTRPAGLMVKIIKSKKIDAKLKFKESVVDATRLYQVMSLGIKQNDTFVIEFSGENEDLVKNEVLGMFEEENL
jgi:phosphotransferase system HPr (HPr) family protein